MSRAAESFDRLLGIMDDLRSKCPWDQKQNLQSLRPLTVEELYELVDEIIKENPSGIREELGDLLLHIVFYAKIMQEKQQFDIGEVIDQLCEKLIRRHPHIYGDVELNDADAVKKNWEKLKQAEGKKGLLDGVPESLPSLLKAFRMQDKAKQVGFEWPNLDGVIDKINEEVLELKHAMEEQSKEKILEEYGDVLFSMVNFGRYLGLDPDLALEKVNRKFRTRFQFMESNSTKPLTEMSLEEMEILWQHAKKQLIEPPK